MGRSHNYILFYPSKLPFFFDANSPAEYSGNALQALSHTSLEVVIRYAKVDCGVKIFTTARVALPEGFDLRFLKEIFG